MFIDYSLKAPVASLPCWSLMSLPVCWLLEMVPRALCGQTLRRHHVRRWCTFLCVFSVTGTKQRNWSFSSWPSCICIVWKSIFLKNMIWSILQIYATFIGIMQVVFVAVWQFWGQLVRVWLRSICHRALLSACSRCFCFCPFPTAQWSSWKGFVAVDFGVICLLLLLSLP